MAFNISDYLTAEMAVWICTRLLGFVIGMRIVRYIRQPQAAPAAGVGPTVE
jgi:hypothetical protein